MEPDAPLKVLVPLGKGCGHVEDTLATQ
jgi:hypothetical protein